ncbi:MAG: isoprenyl transferase [Phycisphaerae bacterium]|nr:isoprenyl transferase [Phycisphaerae bacterium]
MNHPTDDPATPAAISSDPASHTLPTGADFAVLPRHIALIMDGNGRWARQQGQPRLFGHQRGAEAARATMFECARLGVEALTLYSFSTENWKRPTEEVDFLMKLGHHYLQAEKQAIHERNLRFVHLGSPEGLPPQVVAELCDLQELTAGNTGMVIALALNYGSRREITEAARTLARRVATGELDAEQITEDTLGAELDTATLPDPDLLIRTAGEHRLSNFLLWQVSYAEMIFLEECWPDFTTAHLHAAIREFGRRQRRFGDIDSAGG